MCKKNHISKIRVGILIFFLFPFRCFSQDISGVWVGNMYNDTTQQTIHYELAINDVNGKTNGFSHTTFIIDSVKNIGVKEVKIKVKKDRVFVEDEKFVYDNYTEPPAKGVKMYSFLTLSHNDSSEVLAGTWRTNATREYNPLTGSIFLEKKKKVQPEQTIIVKKLIDLGLADKLAFLPPLQNIASKNSNEELAVAQKAKVDSSRKLQEQESLAKAQKAKDDSIRKLQEQETLAKVQMAKDDSIRKLQEQETLAKAQKAKDDSVRKLQEQEALAKVHAQQAKDNLARQQLAREELAKAKKTQEELARQQQEQEELAKAAKAKEEIARRQQAEELAKTRKANPTAAAEISKRKLETIRTVEIAQDSLVFSLYDNGAVDGDTVSVLLNGQVIMPRVGLLVTATSKTIYLTPEMGDSISVVMYAENLGSIPPNTGLLVIHDGTKIYEIRFSGDLSKNSKIILVRKKKT